MSGKLIQTFNRACFMLVIPLITIIHIMLNVNRGNLHIVKLFIDDLIPFNRFFIIPYIYWFAYVFVILFYFAAVDYNYYFRLLMSIVAGMFICFIIFYLYPTTVPRPVIVGNDLFSWLVRDVTYKNDNPYNCFPSIHVLNALLATLFFCKYNKNRILQGLSIVSCVLISLSTLFVKQHYFLDGIASLLLGTTMFLLFTNDYLWNRIPVKSTIEYIKAPEYKDSI